MSWLEIPLTAIPFQTVNAVVNGQNYRITVRQLGVALFTSLMVDGAQVTSNVIASVNSGLIPHAQTLANTQIYWVDTQGADNPRYDGLGDRWRLIFEANDV